LAEAITTLAGDAALRERFGKAGRENIARDQSWEAMAERIMSLCSEASAGRPLSPHH
jgi:glycosyltransferase involved in cell wall biosynthesis